MIPGRHECQGQGWKTEYWGYLMSGKTGDKGKREAVCVDQAPEADAKGADNKNQAYMTVVESNCGALPCPPYDEAKALSCVVCSK